MADCNCKKKKELTQSEDKISFIHTHCPSFLKEMESLSQKEIKCSLCLLNLIMENADYKLIFNKNKEIIEIHNNRMELINRYACEF